jgi:hypothetical protein
MRQELRFQIASFRNFHIWSFFEESYPKGLLIEFILPMIHLLVIHSAGERIIVSTPTRFNGIAVAKYLRKQFPKVSVALLY